MRKIWERERERTQLEIWKAFGTLSVNSPKHEITIHNSRLKQWKQTTLQKQSLLLFFFVWFLGLFFFKYSELNFEQS